MYSPVRGVFLLPADGGRRLWGGGAGGPRKHRGGILMRVVSAVVAYSDPGARGSQQSAGGVAFARSGDQKGLVTRVQRATLRSQRSSFWW